MPNLIALCCLMGTLNVSVLALSFLGTFEIFSKNKKLCLKSVLLNKMPSLYL